MRLTTVVIATSAVALMAGLSGGVAQGKRAKAVKLEATLTGAKVVPPPGDPDGKGTARFSLRGKRLCWRLVVKGIGKPHAAHIHAARAGKEGPAIVPLFLRPKSLEEPKRGCVEAQRLEVKDIARHPGRYYVNIHNHEYENGAVRGQLSRP